MRDTNRVSNITNKLRKVWSSSMFKDMSFTQLFSIIIDGIDPYCTGDDYIEYRLDGIIDAFNIK